MAHGWGDRAPARPSSPSGGPGDPGRPAALTAAGTGDLKLGRVQIAGDPELVTFDAWLKTPEGRPMMRRIVQDVRGLVHGTWLAAQAAA